MFFAAAVFTILSSIIGFIYFLGVWTSLRFEWMRPVIPYLHAFIVCALLLWVIALAMDYVGVRRAALIKPQTVDFDGLLAIERTERDRLLTAEKTERDRLIDCVNHKVDDWLQRTNETLNGLIRKPEPEPTLKQQIINLHDRLTPFEQEYEMKSHLQRESGESGENFVTRQCDYTLLQNYRMAANFRIQFERDMRSVSDRIQAHTGDWSLTTAIDQATQACNPEKIKEIRERLWECARTMEK